MSKPEENQLPVRWQKAQVAAILIVPLVIAWVGHSYTASLKEAETGARYVELAVGILPEPPPEDGPNLRTWAISVVDHYAPIELSDEAKRDLEQERLASYSGHLIGGVGLPTGVVGGFTTVMTRMLSRSTSPEGHVDRDLVLWALTTSLQRDGALDELAPCRTAEFQSRIEEDYASGDLVPLEKVLREVDRVCTLGRRVGSVEITAPDRHDRPISPP